MINHFSRVKFKVLLGAIPCTPKTVITTFSKNLFDRKQKSVSYFKDSTLTFRVLEGLDRGLLLNFLMTVLLIITKQ